MEGSVIKSLLVGAIAGGAVMWFYGDRIRDDVDDVTMNMRERAAAGLRGRGRAPADRRGHRRRRIERGGAARELTCPARRAPRPVTGSRGASPTSRTSSTWRVGLRVLDAQLGGRGQRGSQVGAEPRQAAEGGGAARPGRDADEIASRDVPVSRHFWMPRVGEANAMPLRHCTHGCE